MCMTEALCHAVRKYDLHEWGSRFFLSHDRPETIVHDYVTNMLNDKCDEVATSSRECANAPADATIPPTFTSASAYRVFEPTLLAMAIESQSVEEQRIRTQMELTQMEIEEENYLADSAIMDDAVVGEIEVTTEDHEPLDYEDAIDDALNATIHTVFLFFA
ncbi:unnamed protein product [Strongylus vulgaris]|uniref:Uncharacterized protein n=1 Tax=Strongylus vulgaris TaxID=40348 RepID=A0A3P7JUU5_STRVU|nr:unnamed protein product [Strongylus vulgaris]